MRWLALLAMLQSGCVSTLALIGRGNSGTCEGTCARYFECTQNPTMNFATCRTECPNTLPTESARLAFESLTCADVVAYVDGTPPTAANRNSSPLVSNARE